MTEIRIERLVHEYPGGRRALDGIDLVVAAGSRVAFVGRNGSGKTTLVRHLDGLLRPTRGRVLLDGQDIAGRTVADLANDVGLAFQDPDRQVFARSARAEVAFGPRNLGRRGAVLDAAVDAALRAMGLADDGATNPNDLGRAARKRLAISAILAMETAIVVLDEPTGGQDAAGVDRVRRAIEAAAGAGRTVVVVSHDLRFVAEVADRVVVLDAGRVVLDGPPADVFAARSWPTVVAAGLEPPWSAIVGDRLGLGSTPTDEVLIAALGGGPGRSVSAPGPGSPRATRPAR